jgi:hypothetical protein
MGFKDEAIKAAQDVDRHREDQAQQSAAMRHRALQDRKTQSEIKAVERVRNWFCDVAGTEPGEDQVVIVDYFYRQLSSGFENIPDETPGSESWISGVLLAWSAEGERFVASYSFSYKNDTAMFNPRDTKHESFDVWVLRHGQYSLALTKEELGHALMGMGSLKRNSWDSGATWSPYFTIAP